MRFGSLEEALQYARAKELQSHRLYQTFQKVVRDGAARAILSDLAQQELRHMNIIEKALAEGDVERIGGGNEIPEISFSDYLPDGEIDERSDVQEIMQYAMKMERMAVDLYRQLQHACEGTALENLFRRLAEEELKHKGILEDQYEEHFLQWM